MKVRRTLLGLVALAAALLPLPLLAADSCSLGLLGTFPVADAALGVAFQGSTLYVAGGSAGLLTFDVGNPGAVMPLATLDTAGTASDVVVTAGRGYVADGAAGLAIIDVSDPANPQLLGSIGTPDFAAGVAVDPARKVAFVAAKTSGVRVFDVSTPSLPKVLGSLPTPGYARNLLLDGQTLYVADWQAGLLVVDVSNAAVPRVLGGYDTADRAVDLAKGGSIVWIADNNDGVVAVDVSNPASPVLVSSIATPVAATGVELVGSRLFVLASTRGVIVEDVSLPRSPVQLDTLDTYYAYDLTFGAGVAFLADYYGGLKELSVATCLAAPPTAAFTFDPASPTAGETVRFFDASTGGADAWHWDFGDGATSDLQNPTHAWAQPGTFTVTLTASNDAGSSSASHAIVVACPVPCPTAPVLVLPGAARAPGAAGTLWRSDLVVFNPSPAPVTVTVEYVPFGQTTPFGASPSTVPSHGTLVVSDLLGTLFGVTSGAGEARLRPATGTTVLPFAALRTFNSTDAGSYGQWIPAVVDTDPAAAGSRRWLAGLRNDASARTNLGVANFGTVPLAVTVSIVAPDGTVVATELLSLAGSEARQIPLVGSAVDGLGLFSARIDRTSGGAFTCWASRVDNLSGDPTFAPEAAVASGGAILPGIASTAGAAGTRWKSRLVGLDPGAVPATARLLFHPANNPSSARIATLSLGAGSSSETADCLRDLFGGTADEFGWIEIAADAVGSPLPALAAATWNDAPTGSFGQTILPLRPDLSMAGPTTSAMALPGVERSAAVRTNLGLVNLGAAPATARIELLGADGQVAGTREVTVSAGDVWQGDLFDGTGISGDFAIGTALVRPLSGGPLVAYASRVDNRTGDPTFIAPVTVRP